MEVTVLYCSRQGLESYDDKGFGGISVEWDIPLLDGYKSVFLKNWSRKPVVGGLMSLINPSIIKVLAHERPDALLVHGYSHLTTLMGIVAARILKIPVLMRGDSNPLTHQYANPTAFKNRIRHTNRELVFRLVTGFLAIGTKNRDFYLNHQVDAEKIYLAPFSVNNDYFRERMLTPGERSSFLLKKGVHSDLPAILFAGKMTPRKRALDLIKAYELLRAKNIDCQLLMVGDGEQRNDLEAYVLSHKLSDVEFLGFRNQSELPAWYSASDVFVLPSENEPWGLSVNEALSVGTPTVASDEIGAAFDLIEDGVTGAVFPAGDIGALADAIERVLGTSNGLRDYAMERMDSWSYKQTIDGIRAAMRDVSLS